MSMNFCYEIFKFVIDDIQMYMSEFINKVLCNINIFWYKYYYKETIRKKLILGGFDPPKGGVRVIFEDGSFLILKEHTKLHMFCKFHASTIK